MNFNCLYVKYTRAKLIEIMQFKFFHKLFPFKIYTRTKSGVLYFSIDNNNNNN